MRKTIVCLLLAALLLSGCSLIQSTSALTTEPHPAATLPTAPESELPVSESAESLPVTTEPVPETTEPVPETTEPVPETTEPDVGLAGTVLELSRDLRVSPEEPQTELVISIPETDLTGAPEGRLCDLLVYRDGVLQRAFCSVTVVPGTERRLPLSWTFTRYMPETAELSVTLRYGQEKIYASTEVTLENLPDEVYAAESGDKRPYSIDVIRNHNVVAVYGKDGAGEYTMPVKVFVCSTGGATPLGTYSIGDKHVWGGLFGGVYGQYVSRITGNILFHSVPYYGIRKDLLETAEYNKLGTKASMGCVRLPVRDCKWIYDNCPYGTRVRIYEKEELDFEKPVPVYIDPEDPRAGWDPTDPDPANPWLEEPEVEPDPEFFKP